MDVVDLNGELKNLRKPEAEYEYASTILSPGSVYILVNVQYLEVTVLLRNSELLTSKFITRVANSGDSKKLKETKTKNVKNLKSKKKTQSSSHRSILASN